METELTAGNSQEAVFYVAARGMHMSDIVQDKITEPARRT